MKYFDAFELVYKEEYPTLVEALGRERQIKGMTKTKKEQLIKEKSSRLVSLNNS